MRFSQLFVKTLRQPPKDAQVPSHKLLVQAGFINQLAAGVFSYLPLGWRVYRKIEQIIREEIDAIGGQELSLPVLNPRELWEETGRWSAYTPPLLKTKDQHGRQYCLAPTHEEVITDLGRKMITSYKDLPKMVYQIQDKFRNEVRATGGLLRVKEFMMKDLYSFHADQKDLDDYYQKVYQAYQKIFRRCGLQVQAVEAASGSIGGDFCHEFMLFAPTGEDRVAVCAHCGYMANMEVTEGKTTCPKCQGKLATKPAIELGHVFKLGDKYSKAMKAEYVDKKGQSRPLLMGCYGIGLGRLLAGIVEANHDQKGIIWPESVAPFAAHLLAIPARADQIYQQLQKAGVAVLYDDREVSAGVKFADADLIGIPVRLVVSQKTGDKIEWKKRGEKKTELLTIKELIARSEKNHYSYQP